ncbi:MAG TPA: MarR family transcriptional regulator [Stellaceae bacterium]|jgi:DNA-binding MarR family transcriptional regulator|nr:MarR family transcriptional regulator [Stellaceae bacterium]
MNAGAVAVTKKKRSDEEHHRLLTEAIAPLVVEIFRINGAFLAAGNRLSRDLGLTSARWQVLGSLQDGPRTIPQIARRMGLSRQSVRRLVDLLTRQKQVEALDNPNHRKSDLFRLTAAGVKSFKKLTQRQQAWHPRVAGNMTPATLIQATAVLRQLREQLEDDNG